MFAALFLSHGSPMLVLTDSPAQRGSSPARPVDGPQPPGVVAFAGWFDAAIRGGREDDLLHDRMRAPYAVRQHPTDEHLLPLYVALGAGGEKPAAKRLHSSAMYSSLRMDAYAFR